MSVKVAVILGDYSNGWSDSWVVQMPAGGINQAKIGNDKEAVMAHMSLALQGVVDFISKNEKINPVAKDAPCCGAFEDWFKKNQDAGFCGKCGVRISDERAKKFKEVPF